MSFFFFLATRASLSRSSSAPAAFRFFFFPPPGEGDFFSFFRFFFTSASGSTFFLRLTFSFFALMPPLFEAFFLPDNSRSRRLTMSRAFRSFDLRPSFSRLPLLSSSSSSEASSPGSTQGKAPLASSALGSMPFFFKKSMKCLPIDLAKAQEGTWLLTSFWPSTLNFSTWIEAPRLLTLQSCEESSQKW